MSIEIKLPTTLVRYTENQQLAKVSGSTVGECLEHLVKQFPDLEKVLFDKSGQLVRYIDVYVNQESTYAEKLVKPVNDGDKLHIVMVLAGG